MNVAEYDKMMKNLLAGVRKHRAGLIDILGKLQAEIENDNVMEATLKRLISDTSSETVESIVSYDTTYAIVNNKDLSKDEAKKINQDDFDVIVDIPRHLIRARKNPADKNCVLVECDCHGIGRQRLEIIAYMAAHKGVWIDKDKFEDVFSAVGDIKDTSFTQIICTIRKVLRTRTSVISKNHHKQKTDSTYIETMWGKSISKRAAYRFNPQWQYLVLKKDF